ncbi:CDP-paratose 2-epimerase [Candidatus Woesearchaeota archaeon CG10_big_fil_rev_8_21_14_0_10_34_8]|nr:MAG: CDP-paratose 2-epimerase [Candidatus Woesearchaeota archaeon CG10_big_fil_rev_8_21_14_0_10_34_8]
MQSILVIGGAGFIGSNLIDYYCKKSSKIIIFDNVSREGVKNNVFWLQKKYPVQVSFVKGDIRTDTAKLSELMEKVDVVFHLAGQVAVTSSVKTPLEDCHINVIGTLNILEAIRNSQKKPMLLFSSSNKVYGELMHIPINEIENRYVYEKLPFGISESHNLDFHSPYGCSKGAADQYVRDYSRIYGLRTVVFRQSCIYGYRQFGSENQGWLAWFIIATLTGKPLTIYGNGKQIRDVLFIDDLCEAYDTAVQNIDKTSGKIYNVGGGSDNALSILELVNILEEIFQKKIEISFGAWRPGDQKVFISDIRKAKSDFGWMPKISPKEGIKKLVCWVKENKDLFNKVL